MLGSPRQGALALPDGYRNFYRSENRMSNGKPIPIWFSEEDRRRVEEAATLAGYKHLSTYIRDKVLGRGDYRFRHDGMESWAGQQALSGRFAVIDRNLQTVQASLAMLLFLIRKKATTGDINELRTACHALGVTDDPLEAIVPELAELLPHFMGNA
jgi:hypothetical protein